MLGPVFAYLFQQSINTGEIPKEWSLANICPCFKKSDRSLASNYRPVSLHCVPCELLEHIVCSNGMAYLDEHKLLSNRQHVFRKRHSCKTQLTTVINDWAKVLGSRGQIDTSILDFEKAFDTQSHWNWWKDIEMDRFFSILQTTAYCYKWSKIWLGYWSIGMLGKKMENEISITIRQMQYDAADKKME